MLYMKSQHFCVLSDSLTEVQNVAVSWLVAAFVSCLNSFSVIGWFTVVQEFDRPQMWALSLDLRGFPF